MNEQIHPVILMRFINRIRGLRRYADLSIEHAALALGVTPANYAAWEDGSIMIHEDPAFPRFLKLYHSTVDWVVHGWGEARPGEVSKGLGGRRQRNKVPGFLLDGW